MACLGSFFSASVDASVTVVLCNFHHMSLATFLMELKEANANTGKMGGKGFLPSCFWSRSNGRVLTSEIHVLVHGANDYLRLRSLHGRHTVVSLSAIIFSFLVSSLLEMGTNQY